MDGGGSAGRHRGQVERGLQREPGGRRLGRGERGGGGAADDRAGHCAHRGHDGGAGLVRLVRVCRPCGSNPQTSRAERRKAATSRARRTPRRDRRFVAQCACLERLSPEKRPRLHRCLERGQRSVFVIILGGAAFVASGPVISVALKDINAGTTTNSELAARTWAVSRGVSWVGTAMLVLLLLTCVKRRKERKTNFGKQREQYGWTAAADLPRHPPDVCLLVGWCLPADYADAAAAKAPTAAVDEPAQGGDIEQAQGAAPAATGAAPAATGAAPALKHKKKKKKGGAEQSSLPPVRV